MKTVPIGKFGKDHWSLLAFIETVCVDEGGVIGSKEKSRMRCNEKTHPQHDVHKYKGLMWKSEFGTRLAGFFETKKENLHLPEHDDWDCAEDLENAGLIMNVGTGVNPIFKLTTVGIAINAKLREHKASGGIFANFNMEK